MPEALIIDAVRSPRGKGKATGALHDLHPQELLAQVLNALCRRVGIDPADVDDVQIGNASGEGDHGMCIGRLSVLAAGWPVSVPAVTVNRPSPTQPPRSAQDIRTLLSPAESSRCRG
jgi:acetyl-CoA C-acetyltransferase